MKARSIVAVLTVVSAVGSMVACGAPPDQKTESQGEAMQSSSGVWGMPGGPAGTPVKENCAYQSWGGDAFTQALMDLNCSQPQIDWGTWDDFKIQYWNLSVCPNDSAWYFTCPAQGNAVVWGNYSKLIGCWAAWNGATQDSKTCAGTYIGPGYVGIQYDPNCDGDCLVPKPPM